LEFGPVGNIGLIDLFFRKPFQPNLIPKPIIMARSVSAHLSDLLEEAGVQQVFGVTGDALNYLVSNIEEKENMSWVGMRHEGNAAFAAYAQAALSNNLGVCAGTIGPGALHLINGLYSAKRERTPILAVTGQVERTRRGSHYFQETDLQKVFDDLCAFQAIIRTPESATRVMQKAIQIALAHNTICRIELPADLGDIDAGKVEDRRPILRSDAQLFPGRESIQKAANLINDHSQITILAGAGCRNAKDEVIQLAKTLKAPIVNTLRASDIFDFDTEQVIGQTGLLGNPSAYKAVKNCDVLLMIGTDFPYDEFLPYEKPTIQIDNNLTNIGNRTYVDVGIHGDAQPSIRALLKQVNSTSNEDFQNKHLAGFADWKNKKQEEASLDNDVEPLHPQLFSAMVNQHAASDAIIALDTSTAVIWAARTISFFGDRRILGSFNHGSMSVGLPAGIGAQILYPDREVWVLAGDGGFSMGMQDLITAANLQLPLKIIIFNNSELSLIKLEMEKAGESPNLSASSLDNPDFAAFAKMCGGDGVRVEHADQIKEAIRQAKQAKGPFIIDAIVNSGELPFPPDVTIDDAVKLTQSKLKEVKEAASGNTRQWENLVKEIKALIH